MNQPNFLLRKGTEADLEEIARLVHELAVHENSLPEMEITTAQLIADGSGPEPLFEALLAISEEGQIIGMALYFYTYSSWKGKTLYLEDLYLRENARGLGIGREFIEQLKAEARAGGARRLLLQAHVHNEAGLAFYRHLGAQLDDSWVNCSIPV